MTNLVRVDLLARLEETGALSATGLHISNPDLPFEQYEALGVFLGHLQTAVKWWIGDWLLLGEELYGDAAAQASEALNLSVEGRQECLRVALAIPRSRRRASLSWWHHRLVAARWIAPAEREQLLNAAEAERLTTRELEDRVRDLRALEADSRGATAAECEEVTTEAIRMLRAVSSSAGRSRSCGLRGAADRATVDRFQRAAVEAGGRDNGAPGHRPH